MRWVKSDIEREGEEKEKMVDRSNRRLLTVNVIRERREEKRHWKRKSWSAHP